MGAPQLKTHGGRVPHKMKDLGGTPVDSQAIGRAVLWSAVVWSAVVWCGVVWCGVVWCGVVWCGVVWCGVPKALLPEGNGRDVYPRVQVNGRGCVCGVRAVCKCVVA